MIFFCPKTPEGQEYKIWVYKPEFYKVKLKKYQEIS
jgi:hypothetical protein